MPSHFGFHPRQQFLAKFLITQAPTSFHGRGDSPGRLGTGLPEGFQEPIAVQAILEDGFAAVATIQDVVNGAGVLDANLAGHATTVSNSPRFVNRKKCAFAGLTPLWETTSPPNVPRRAWAWKGRAVPRQIGVMDSAA